MYMNFNEDTHFLISLAQQAAGMAQEAFSPSGVDFELKRDNSPVTKTDVAINQMVIDEVQKHRPEWGVLGEELQWNEDSEILLVVDPIDGTKPFTWGQATFGCMFPLVKDGRVTSAVVINPILQRTVAAEKGQGTWLVESKEQLYVSKTDTLKSQTVYVHSKSVGCVPDILQAGGGFVAGNSAAEISFMVSRGAWVGAILNLPSPHDIACAKLLVEEAGGVVTDINGNDQAYDGLLNGAVISNGVLHEELLSICRSHVQKN